MTLRRAPQHLPAPHSSRLIACLLLVVAFANCEMNDYDKDNGKYSTLHADFAEVTTKQSKTLVAAALDNGDSLTLQPALACEWAEAPATTYRALLYYYPTDNEGIVKPYGAQPVYVLPWHDEYSKPATTLTDPLHVEATWMSHNKAYINLRVGIMVGTDDEGNRQSQQIGVTLDNTHTHTDGTHTYQLTLRHAQNDVPQYYTSTQYLSLPLNGCTTGDTISLSVNTYDGQQHYTFCYK